MIIAEVYRPSPIKRLRRTRAQMDGIRAAVEAELSSSHPQTVRQVFYRLASAGVVPKDEAMGYRVVQRLLVEMRMSGLIPFAHIADSTRWMRKPRAYASLEQAVSETAEFYRRDLWRDADVYVEVWCEKDALAGVIMEETAPYDVPLMVARGFASVSFLHNAARHIAEQGKPAHVFHFGDHDPSGRLSERKIEETLRRFAPEATIRFEHVAVTPAQITRMGLPTRPTKREGNAHAKGFNGRSVELDAIPSDALRRMVRDAIERHVDKRRLAVLLEAEESEREILRRWRPRIRR